MNFILGGDFASRINMNLREDKHWSYGARSILAGARGQRPFLAYAPVQADKTKETMVGDPQGAGRHPGQEAHQRRRIRQRQEQPDPAAAGPLGDHGRRRGIARRDGAFGLADDYFKLYPQPVLQLTDRRPGKAARKAIHPEAWSGWWSGDRAAIEPGIRELGLRRVFVIDGDGNIVK